MESGLRHDKVYASSQRGGSINTMRSRPRARRKDFLVIPTLDSWKSGYWSRARREFPSCGGPFVSHVWSRGLTMLAGRTDVPMMLLFFCPVISLWLSQRRESRRASERLWLSWLRAILYAYVRCWVNISDHRGVECPATIITQYQVHMHEPFTCVHTGGVETRGDCE